MTVQVSGPVRSSKSKIGDGGGLGDDAARGAPPLLDDAMRAHMLASYEAADAAEAVAKLVARRLWPALKAYGRSLRPLFAWAWANPWPFMRDKNSRSPAETIPTPKAGS